MNLFCILILFFHHLMASFTDLPIAWLGSVPLAGLRNMSLNPGYPKSPVWHSVFVWWKPVRWWLD